MTNPNIDPNMNRPVETVEMHVKAEQMNDLMNAGANEDLAEVIAVNNIAMQTELTATKTEAANAKAEADAARKIAANAEAELVETNNSLRKSRRFNKILGGVAVIAAGIAVWSPFGGNSDKKNTDRAATKNIAAQKDTAKDTSVQDETAKAGTMTTFGKTTPGASTKEKPAANKSAAEKLQDRIDHADNAKTVAGAVDRANPTPGTINEMIRQMTNGKDVKDANNVRDAWGSLAERIKTEDVTASEAKLGIALNAEANLAVARGTANILNNKDPLTANSMTHKEALRSIVQDLTNTTNSQIETASGLENHGFNGNAIYSAGDSGKIRTFSTIVEGHKQYFKVVCLNGEWKMVKTVPTSPAPTPTPEGGPKQPKPEAKFTPTPGDVITPKPGQTVVDTPKTPVTPEAEIPDEDEGEKPKPKEKEKEKEKPKEKCETNCDNKDEEKKDDSKNPGPGFPKDQDNGIQHELDPDAKPGVSPIGVPVEKPDPTPPPLPNAPAPTVPAETGPDTGAGLPTTPANGSETPAPTTNIDPQG